MARTKQVARRGSRTSYKSSSESSPTGPNKRPRTDEWDDADRDSEAGGARTRDEEFWFEDGSIILVAGDVEFRVFKSILAEYSPVFSDMFRLPQPPSPPSSSEDADEPADPCPVVHLSDAPEDLRHILRVTMPKSRTR